MQHKGDWDFKCPKDAKIVALTAATKELKKQVKDCQKVITKIKDGQATKSNPKKENNFPMWRAKKEGEYATCPDTGDKFVWCNKGHGKGCYMPHPHDHDKWQEEKSAKNKAYAEKKKRKKEDAKDDGGSKKGKGGLIIDPRYTAALTTRLQSLGHSDKEIKSTLATEGIPLKE